MGAPSPGRTGATRGLSVDQVTLDGGVLGFTGFVALLTGILFGAIPAFRASRPISSHG